MFSPDPLATSSSTTRPPGLSSLRFARPARGSASELDRATTPAATPAPARSTLADRLRYAARVAIAFATLDDGAIARPAAAAGAAHESDADVAARLSSAAAARLPAPAGALSAGSRSAAVGRSAWTSPVACSPHPHRRPLPRRRPERRHGAAPARPQLCLTPTGVASNRPTSRSAAARTSAGAGTRPA